MPRYRGTRYTLWGGAPVLPAPTPAFSPAEVAGLKLWLKADGVLWQDSARTTAATADGDPVGAWDDASGLGNHATQATSTRRPTLKLAVQNGKPVLRFDAVDDVFNLTATMTSAPSTALAVLTPSAGGTRTLTCGNADSLQYRVESDGKQRLVRANVADMGVSTSALSQAAFNVAAYTYASPDAAFRRNGAADGTLSTAQPFTDPVRYVGSAEPFGQDLAELLFYDAALAAADLQRLEAYLNARWGVY
jgi:hypothetical protein